MTNLSGFFGSRAAKTTAALGVAATLAVPLMGCGATYMNPDGSSKFGNAFDMYPSQKIYIDTRYNHYDPSNPAARVTVQHSYLYTIENIDKKSIEAAGCRDTGQRDRANRVLWNCPPGFDAGVLDPRSRTRYPGSRSVPVWW